MRLLLKNLLFTVLVPGTVAIYAPLGIGGWPSSAHGGLGALLAVPVLALGAALYAWCVWDFAVAGRGTPAPMDAPRRLVARGLYRHTRNPMYLGVLTAILGWTLLFRTAGLVAYNLIVAAGFHLFVILYGEPHLRRRFGRGYAEYCRRVPRWLPGIRRSITGAARAEPREERRPPE